MVLLAAVVSGCKEDSKLPAASAIPATEPAAVNEVPPERKLSDAELLGSPALTFEQKRSKLYALIDAAEAGVGFVRHEANYVRTTQRLAGYRMKFNPEAERRYSELIERVQEYLSYVRRYAQRVGQRAGSVKPMEMLLYQELKAARLDQSARNLYIEIAGHDDDSIAAPYWWVFQRPENSNDFSVVGDVRGRILRRAVGGDDLFKQLVAIRVCQRCLEGFGELDDRVAQLVEKLPDPILARGGFSRAVSKAKQPLTREQQILLFRGYLDRQKEQGDDDSEVTYTLDDVERLEAAQGQKKQEPKPLGVVMSKEARGALMNRLAEDAGLLEISLRDLLLDYPWPWPVPTVTTNENVFSLASRPSP